VGLGKSVAINFANTYTPDVTLKRTVFDDGYKRQASHQTATYVQRDVEYLLCDAASFKEFRRWWQEDLRKGSLWFLWRDPLKERQGDSQPVRARILEGKVNYKAQEASHGVYIAAFTLEHLYY
jgi:hypothetical protein